MVNWVKRLGQWHLAKDNASKTTCGMPMLGNNYDKNIAEGDRDKCEVCFNEATNKAKRDVERKSARKTKRSRG